MNNSAFNNQVSKTIKGAESSFSKGFSKIGKIVTAAFSVGAVISFGKTCVSVASQTEGAWIGLKSIVDGQGKSFSKAKDFLNEYTKDGLIPLTNAVTAYKNLAARGYDDKQIQQTLTSLKDAAAFGRQASYSYGEAIQSATEGLKNENSILVDNAGVTKNVAKMWDDYAKSVGKTTNQLTQQEKITAEVNGILEETKFQTGDAARYADTFAGKTARLSQTFYTLKNTIGEVIMPIANLFIPIIQKAMDKLVGFFNIIKQVMSALGLKSSSVLNDTSSSFTNIGSSASQAANEATKASKKMQRAIMPYDEINRLTKSSDSGSGSSGNTSSTGGSSSSNVFAESAEDTISPKAQAIADKCSAIWQTLKKKTSEIWDSQPVQSFVGFITSELNFYVELWKTLFTDFGNNVRTTWGNIEDNVDIAIGNLSYLWTSYFETLQSTIETYGPSVIFNVSELFNSIWVDAIDPFIQLATTMWSEFTSILVELWDEYGQPLADNIGKFVEGVTDTFNKLWTHIFKPIIEPFLQMVSDLWNNHLKDMLKEIGNFVLNTINSVLEIYNKVGKPIVDFLVEVLGPIFSATFNQIWNVIKTIVGFISDSINNLMKIFNGIVDFITGIFTGNWKKAWNGIKNIFSGIFSQMANIIKTPLNLILDVVEGFINKIIAGFNSVKKVINKFKIDVPDWLSDLTGMKTFGFNLKMSDPISLPRLANGGWVEPNKPRPVIVGDNKKEGEIIAPESKIYEQALKANEASNQNKNNKVVIDLRLKMDYPDGHYMIKEINDVQIEDGYISLLT